MQIEKALAPNEITAAQLEAIHRYTRRALGAEELYVFSVILCDNEIDRDFEQFPPASLETLAELFLGTTGVFDHEPLAENQSARIFETRVVREERHNAVGEPYCCLRAWAYMVRCEKNADLILEIDGGIKKEVSVGCAVDRVLCSVCGADQKEQGCSHQKGREYKNRLCWHLLADPADAYEWSFVAVPAQKNAGVTKTHGGGGQTFSGKLRLDKLFAASGDILLTADQLRCLHGQYKRLEAQAKDGEAYRSGLRREVIRLALLSQPELDEDLARDMTKGLDTAQLGALRKSWAITAGKRYPLPPQLGGPPQAEEGAPDSRFRV